MTATAVHEREFSIAVDTVWNALVAPDEAREWYFRLTPKGDWREGGRIIWHAIDGSAAEESIVEEMDAPRRLTLETRYLFAPALAAEPPLRVTWTIEPHASGCRVRLSAAGSPASARLMESAGGNILQGLRLAIDPVARAELRRLDEIGEVVVREVTPDRVSHYLAFFDHDAFRDNPAWSGCYCLETHFTGTDDELASRTGADNRAEMARLIERAEVTAVLAYASDRPPDRPVGWCNYGQTTRLGGLLRRYGLEPADQEGVGSIACLTIATPYRSHGIAGLLVEAACDRLASRGLRWVEAYPPRDRSGAVPSYRGSLELYRRHGFEPYREAGRTVVVRRPLSPLTA